nr:MAG TPA: hypothetical protein [Caudoviricetes sp.]
MCCNTRYCSSKFFYLIHKLDIFSYNIRHCKIQCCYLIKLSRLSALSSWDTVMNYCHIRE